MNDTTFQGDGKIAFVPVVVNAKQHKQTNADKIRSMTDEELADFLWHRDIQIVERASKVAGFNYSYDEAQCIQNIKDWLKATVEVDNG